MVVTKTVMQRSGADRAIAFAAYGMLATSVLTAGLTGLAAVILAYVARDAVSPAVRRHLNALIGMFWVTFVLWAVCVGTGAAAVLREIDELANGSGAYLSKLQILAWTVDVSRWRLVPEVLGLVAISVVSGLAGLVWSFVAPALGVIRLASQHTTGVTGEP